MAYEVRLSQFSGPLDLLLHLIERAEMDIRDIFVSEITSEYLSYMRGVDELDMDTASEFLAMAATLLYIKSRSLLPRPLPAGEEEEFSELTLIRQLQEYKALKEASHRLLEIQQAAEGMFTKLPEELIFAPPEVTLTDATVAALYDAFLEALSRSRVRMGGLPVQNVSQDRFTVRAQTQNIRRLLVSKPSLLFTELFQAGAPREEIIATFLALLDMLVRNEIILKQRREFGEIAISSAKLIENDADIAYIDE